MTDHIIRPARRSDASGFARSQIDAWRAAYAGLLPAEYLAGMDHERLTAGWDRRLSSPQTGVRQLTLDVDGQVMGWSGFGTPRDTVDDGVGELHALNVSPRCWSKGLGSALFRRSVTELAALGYSSGYPWVADGNSRAIAFYERHGWVVDGVTKDDDRFSPPLRELRMGTAFP